MFNCLEFLDHLLDLLQRNAHVHTDSNRCHNIFMVMTAKQLQIVDIDNHGLFLAVVVYNLILFQVETLFQGTQTGKIYHLDVF